MRQLRSKLKAVDRLVFSPDGRHVAAAGGKRQPVEVWSEPALGGASIILPIQLEEGLWACGFSPADGLLLAAEGTELAAFALDRGEEVWRVEPESGSVISGIDFSPDGKRFVISFLFQYLSEGGYQFWEPFGRKPPKRRRVVSGTPDCMCRGVAFIPPGDRVAFAEDDPAAGLSLVNVFRGSRGQVARMESPYQQARKITPSADGRYLAGSYSRTFLVWNLSDADAPVAKVSNNTRHAFTGIAFHPSSRFLAATSNDTTVKLYDTATWQLDRTFTWDVGRLRSVAFSPDGALAAVGSDTGRVVVWDVDL